MNVYQKLLREKYVLNGEGKLNDLSENVSWTEDTV